MAEPTPVPERNEERAEASASGGDRHASVEENKRLRDRTEELEIELSTLANLYVASFQLNATLRFKAVVQNIHELLTQLVGARAYGVYFVDASGTSLVPIASEGEGVGPVSVAVDASASKADACVSETLRRGEAFVRDADASGTDLPIACIPLRLDAALVGVIAVFSLHPHKARLAQVDHQLFKLLGTHAAGALVSSELFSRAGGKVPPAEAFRKAMD